MDKARRKNICLQCGDRCGDRWKRGHRFENGSVKRYTAEKIYNGETAVQIVEYLVKSMESETIKVVMRHEMPIHANIFSEMFVVSMKSSSD